MPSGVFDGKDNFYLAICDLLVRSECTYTFDGRFAISSETSSSSIGRTSTSSSSSMYVAESWIEFMVIDLSSQLLYHIVNIIIHFLDITINIINSTICDQHASHRS